MTGLRKAIILCARSQVGTPFHHQGRTPYLGLDCVGLIVHVAKSLNLFDHDFKAYAKHPSGDALTVEMEKVCTHLEPDELLPGDIACFYIEPKSRTPQHIAIIAEDGDSMIHAHNGAGKVAETTIGRWASRIICGYRYPIVRDVWQP